MYVNLTLNKLLLGCRLINETKSPSTSNVQDWKGAEFVFTPPFDLPALKTLSSCAKDNLPDFLRLLPCEVVIVMNEYLVLSFL